jgi:hypothetical protein
MKRKTIVLVLAGALLGGLLDLGFTVREAGAVVGMPATPMSYAGVARRTTRRAAYVGAATTPYAAPPAAAYW